MKPHCVSVNKYIIENILFLMAPHVSVFPQSEANAPSHSKGYLQPGSDPTGTTGYDYNARRDLVSFFFISGSIIYAVLRSRKKSKFCCREVDRYRKSVCHNINKTVRKHCTWAKLWIFHLIILRLSLPIRMKSGIFKLWNKSLYLSPYCNVYVSRHDM